VIAVPYVVKAGKRFYYHDSGVGGVQFEPGRLAVATLEEAQRIVGNALQDAGNLYYGPLRESGGTITLPDGETIHAERVLWSTLADDVGVELRWDPPTQDGDYLHAAQREELEAVLVAWNAKHGQT
jgi:hypothetical protein